MKQQQVNKLYSKLTAHEQAALVFEAVARKNKSEADLILDSVKIKNYSMPDLDYQQRITGINNLSGCYGIFYWKTLYQLGVLIPLSLEDDSYDKVIRLDMNKLRSMDIALEAVCKELKVDVLTVKGFAECNDYHPDSNREIDNQLVEQFMELFSKVAYLND